MSFVRKQAIFWKLLLSIENISVIAIILEFTKECFTVITITIEDLLKEISMLDSSKDIQATDIPVKLIKSNSNFFAEFIQ